MKVYPMLAALALLGAGPIQSAEFETGALAYERGRYDQALAELMPLAETGDADAQFLLARMYTRGVGVVQDFVQAHKWYNLAAAGEQRLAAAARDALAERMPAGQVAEAQSLARAWQPEQPSAEPAQSSAPAEAGELSESTVARIQLELKRLGYDIGTVTGQPGEATRAAIRQFQSASGLPVDGQPSAELLRRLGDTEAERPLIRRAPPAGQPTPGEDEEGDWRRLM